MAGRIEKYDILSKEEVDNFKQFISTIETVAKKVSDLRKEFGSSPELQKFAKAMNESQAQAREYVRALNELNRIKARQRTITSDLGKQIENERAALKKNTDEVRKQAQAKQGLVTSFSKLIRSVGVYGAALFSLNKIVQFFTRDLLNMTKTLDSLDFSMKTVIKSQEEVTQTQLFLSKTAQNYGQDILTLTERYIKFRAAAQQSNLSAHETQKIFDSTAKAAAVLGLKTDEVNGVFLALEQMISKGKVTTEELRRQLGERLPGAMGIMADALGVSIVQLDKMLKAGSVLSSEALPKFADALEKAYGIEAVTKVDTLAAAQGRLRTSWVDFVDSINSSPIYIKVIDKLTNQFVILKNTLGDVSQLDYYSSFKNNSSKILNELINDFDKIDNKLMLSSENRQKYLQEWTKRLEETSFGEKRITTLFEEYINRRNSMYKEENKIAEAVVPFDLKEYKKTLDEAEVAIGSYSKQTNESLKQAVLESNELTKDGITDYKQVLILQEQKLKNEQESLDRTIKGYLAIKESVGLTEEQNKRYEAFSLKAIGLTEARIEIANRLADIESGKKKGSTKDDSLATARKNNELIIAILENALQKQAEIDGESKSKELERETLLFDTKKQLNDELLQYVKKGSKEYYDILATSYDLQTQLAQKKANILSKIDDDYWKNNESVFKRWDKERKDKDEQVIADLYAGINEQRVVMAEAATQQLQEEGTTNRKKQEINKKLLLAQLQFERERLQELIDSGKLLVENEQKISDQILQIKEAEERAKRDMQEETRRQQEENLQYLGQAVSNGASFYNQILEGQLARAKEVYEADAAAAGDSAERKYLAEQKYQEEQRKIKRRQAIADKAQALFNIGLELAMASAELNAFQVAAAILAAATVVATPIPEFAKGTEFAPETFIAGEKGTEAIVKKTGETLLTPDKATMFSDKSYIGAKIIPHDETQKLLASQALRQSAGIVDMGKTNKHLSNIERNTKRDKEIFTRNGKVMMKRGIVTSVIS